MSQNALGMYKNTPICMYPGYIATLVTSDSTPCVGCVSEEVSGVTYKVLCTWQLLVFVVDTGWVNSQPGCMNRLRDATLTLWGSFLAGKAVCVLNGPRMLIIAWLVNKWVWLKSRVCLLWLEVHFVLVRAQTEIKYGAQKERHVSIRWRD